MMGNLAHFAFAQARMQAQHGARPSDSTWRMLQASSTLGHYLESARSTGLAPWVTNLGPSSDVHTIEQTLRRDWRGYVDTVAGWLPEAWRPAVRWTAVLADLEREDRNDPVDGTGGWAPGHRPLAAWTGAFRALWPAMSARDARAMDRLMTLLGDHLAPTSGDDGRARGAELAERARERLRDRLTRILHQSAQSPPAVFAFLTLTALDVERLRGDLVRRRLFADMMER